MEYFVRKENLQLLEWLYLPWKSLTSSERYLSKLRIGLFMTPGAHIFVRFKNLFLMKNKNWYFGEDSKILSIVDSRLSSKEILNIEKLFILWDTFIFRTNSSAIFQNHDGIMATLIGSACGALFFVVATVKFLSEHFEATKSALKIITAQQPVTAQFFIANTEALPLLAGWMKLEWHYIRTAERNNMRWAIWKQIHFPESGK